MAFVPKYILILFGLILIDFVFAQFMERAEGRRRKLFLLVSIVSNVGILFVFKYFNFFNQNVADLAQFLHWNYSIESLSLVLPLGLSFHIFQSLSYVIEVYRGKFPAERHLGIYALYVLFYPQLVAGPIERPEHLIPQLKKETAFDVRNVTLGPRLMLWGFFKKLVIADRLAIIVDFVFAHIGVSPGPSILFAMIFFAFQLYADFSGYSDIARGSAQVLGITVVNNFKQPYLSLSVSEFWRRWHISLSNWFRDYFYFPLAYSAQKVTRTWLYVCLFVTFLVTGLWHGAGWTFVVMGGLHGTYLVTGLVTKKLRERINILIGINKFPLFHATLQILMTFAMVSFSWVFFRSPNMHTAVSFIAALFKGWGMSFHDAFYAYFLMPFQTLGVSKYNVIIALLGIFVLLMVDYLERYKPERCDFQKYPLYARSFIYVGLILSIVIFGVFTNQQFIYFQF